MKLARAQGRSCSPATRLIATLVDGHIVTRHVEDMPGFPGQPMSRAGMDHKLCSNAGGHRPACVVAEGLPLRLESW